MATTASVTPVRGTPMRQSQWQALEVRHEELADRPEEVTSPDFFTSPVAKSIVAEVEVRFHQPRQPWSYRVALIR